ncbi:MAG TPA: cellulase family glycosylhydrolase, partial [Archangium sp.]
MAATLTLAACGTHDGGGTPITPDLGKLSCTTPGFVHNDTVDIPVAPNGFATVGNRIIRASDCKTHRFVGVSRPSLSFTATGQRLGDSAVTAQDFATMRTWKVNTVRIELAQYFWVPTAKSYDPGYVARVERVVRQARAAGLTVLLVLQASDRGIANYDPIGNTHQPMADRNHSIPFWRDVATRFKNDGGVLYELYSEPFPIGGKGGFANWDMWLKGGLHPADDVYEPRPAFAAVGMQELYDLVRSTGAHNLVVIGGTKWGYYLEGVAANRVKGYNIVYATHPWDFPGANQPETWEQDWASL